VPALAVADLDVVVAEHPAADVQAPASLDHESLGNALARLLAFELRGKVLRSQEELLGRVIDPDLLTRRVEDELHAGVDDLLYEEAGSEHVATETCLVARDEHVEAMRARRVQRCNDARALHELGAADRVVDEDGVGLEPPALAGYEPLRFGALRVERVVLVLLGRPTQIEGGPHGSRA
jgi:hypothetical protein